MVEESGTSVDILKRGGGPYIEERPNQKQKTGGIEEDDEESSYEESHEIEELNPIDHNQITVLSRLTRVSLSNMIREDATQNNRSFLEVQLLRIISPMNLTGVNGAYIYANRNRNKNNGNQTHYTRLFLLRVHSNDEGNKLLYLMETRNQNRDLWKMNVEHRDNGMLTIGTIFRILAPRPVESFMVGDIPLVVSKFPCFLMETPS